LCRNGINLTQFKLSAFQLKEFASVLEKSLNQWKETTGSLGFPQISGELEVAAEKIKEVQEILQSVIDKAGDAEASDDDVTITPL
jgi:hypothetical protein